MKNTPNYYSLMICLYFLTKRMKNKDDKDIKYVHMFYMLYTYR